MKHWELKGLDVAPHNPQVLSSTAEGRAIALQLPAGEQLQEHQVHERAWVAIIDGEVELTTPNGDAVSGGQGLLFEFDPGERHTVTAQSDVLLLLVLAPWPGEGHPSARAS